MIQPQMIDQYMNMLYALTAWGLVSLVLSSIWLGVRQSSVASAQRLRSARAPAMQRALAHHKTAHNGGVTVVAVLAVVKAVAWAATTSYGQQIFGTSRGFVATGAAMLLGLWLLQYFFSWR